MTLVHKIVSNCKNMLHVKCIGGFYPGTKNTIKRFEVPKDKIPWCVEYPEYKPLEFTASFIHGQPWADLEIQDCKATWNSIDGLINRESFCKTYIIGDDGRPYNPIGRTGIQGRGRLGRWGPNHAADPIVTRWKRSLDGEIQINPDTKKPILQFIAILRGDCKEWAIPGGMVDPGEVVTKTLKREFLEEALDSAGAKLAEKISQFFDNSGSEVYRGYVDDPRNTDNAWMETTAVQFHDHLGDSIGSLALKAGDDAIGVAWKDLSHDMVLYASHINFLEKVAQKVEAHW